MKCPKCGSENLTKDGKRDGRQRYRCKDCGKSFIDGGEVTIGIPLDKWQQKYDVDVIVKQVMENLDPNVMYEKTDIYKLTGLTPSFPGLSPAIESYSEYYGKVAGKLFFSHPDTINHYKKKGRLS